MPEKYVVPKSEKDISDIAPYIAFLFNKYIIFIGQNKIRTVEKESEFNIELEKLRKEGKKLELLRTIEWLDENLEVRITNEAKKDYPFSFRMKYPNWVKLLAKARDKPVASYLRDRIIEEDLKFLKSQGIDRENASKLSNYLKESLSHRFMGLKELTISEVETDFDRYLKDKIKDGEEYQRKLGYMMSFVIYAVKKGMIEKGVNEKEADMILKMIPLDSPYFLEITFKQSPEGVTLSTIILVSSKNEIDMEILKEMLYSEDKEKLWETFFEGGKADVDYIFSDLTNRLFKLNIPIMFERDIPYIKGSESRELLKKENLKKYILDVYIKRFNLEELMEEAKSFERIPITDYKRLKNVTNAALIVDGAKIMAEITAEIMLNELSKKFTKGSSHVFSVRLPVAAERILRLATGMKIKEFVEKKIIGGE